MNNSETYLVTGAAGFIGSAFVRILSERPQARIVVLDALSYAGNLRSIAELVDSGRITFIKGDICDAALVKDIIAAYAPAYVVNFAAESHVDRSVDDPSPFIKTNIEGAYNLLECFRHAQCLKKFVQISTDEVYGDLALESARTASDDICEAAGRIVTMYGDDAFCETTPLKPSSPYSASKASADMLALSYHRSFGMPVALTRCSNNYGPRQFPEKLIPLMINNILEDRPLPVYGSGLNVRDWIHVDDHCRGILAVLDNGTPGEVYNFGAYRECSNIDLVHILIDTVSRLTDEPARHDLIRYVSDRPGHDRRYAIDSRKAHRTLGWRPQVDFLKGMEDTVQWYLDNKEWVAEIVNGDYRNYYDHMYKNR